MKTIIQNTQIVNKGKIETANVIIDGEFVMRISKEPVLDDKATYINGEGLFLLPGVIDDQVHFREPGLTYKAEIETESKAAAAGGITSFMEMPNTNPQTITLENLEAKYNIAAEKSAVNYSFYLGATNDNIDTILKVNPTKVCGVKVFMGSSTGNMLVDNKTTLEKIFAECPVLIATHCEDESTIQHNTQKYKDEYGENMPFKYHPAIRSVEACYKSSSLAVELASKHNTKLHILHISTKKELSLFDSNKALKDKRITAEVCVHHLWFNDADYDKFGARIKWNPAVKSKQDQEALLIGLLKGKLDVIATDHAPHTLEEKSNSYFKAPSGGPLVQHALVAMLEMVKQGKIELPQVVEKMCHAPADLYQVEKRGYVEEGYYADLVLVDLNSAWKVSQENILYKCKWSPFEEETFGAKVKHTFVNGKIVYSDGDFNIPTGFGKRLTFNR